MNIQIIWNVIYNLAENQADELTLSYGKPQKWY